MNEIKIPTDKIEIVKKTFDLSIPSVRAVFSDQGLCDKIFSYVDEDEKVSKPVKEEKNG